MYPPVLTVIKNGLKVGVKATRLLTCGFVNGFDRAGMLTSKRPARASRNAGGVSRWPASSWLVAFGVILCLIAIDTPVKIIDTSNAISIKSHVTFKQYAKQKIQSADQWKCLDELYYRESRWQVDAVGNIDGKHQVYGIPQLKNKLLKDADGYTQINYGLKYLNHRYGVDHFGYTNACKALHHLKTKGWH
jgi:hypothetical protein